MSQYEIKHITQHYYESLSNDGQTIDLHRNRATVGTEEQ